MKTAGDRARRQRYTESDVREFEARMRVALPDSYRRYLIEVGGGGDCKVDCLENWCQPYDAEDLPDDFLSQAFPHRNAWNDRALGDSTWHSAYYDSTLFRGSMRVVNTGCEGYYLLVVTGSERGHIWSDQRASFATGIFPLLGRNGGHLTVGELLGNE